MIVFHPSFSAIAGCVGYFYNTHEDRLYSLKTGTLKPLTLEKSTFTGEAGYYVHNEGRTYFLTVSSIKSRLVKKYVLTSPAMESVEHDPDLRNWEYDAAGVKVWKDTRLPY